MKQITSERTSSNKCVAAVGCVVAVFLAVPVVVLAEPGGFLDDEELEALVRKVVISVAAVEPIQLQTTDSEEDVRTTLEELKELSPNLPSEMRDSLLWYQAKCLQLLGREQEFRQIAREAIRRGIDAPDFYTLEIWMVGEGGGEKAEARSKIWNEHGRIVPISLHGQNRDLSYAPRVLIDPYPPSVPVLGGVGFTIVDSLAEIGELYEEIGFQREAINSYVEALYSSLVGTDEERGRLWLKIAELEAQQGQMRLAIRAYLRSAHTDKQHVEAAIGGIQRALSEAPGEERVATEPRWKRETVVRIAELYRKLNLHPLALAVLARAEGEAGQDLSKEKEATLEEWQAIVERHVQVYGAECHLLGHRVSDVGDWSRVHVLRPSDTFWKPEDLSD